MLFQENLYRMGLIGAGAGLASWAVSVWIIFWLTIMQERYWVIDLIYSGLMGFFIGGFCIAYAYRSFAIPKRLAAILGGGLVGALAGAFATYCLHLIYNKGDSLKTMTVLAWVLSGACIGIAIGVFRHGILFRHILYSMLGGAFGALIGGLALVNFGEAIPNLTNAYGLVFTGFGISYGSTKAIALVGKGKITLDFQFSTAVAVIEWFKNRQNEWDILGKQILLFGSAQRSSKIKHYTFIYVPDHDMEERHAYICESEGKFYVKAHESNRDADDKPSSILCVERISDNKLVVLEVLDAVPLENEDRIIMGQTTFRFWIRGKSRAAGIYYLLSTILALVLFGSVTTASAQSSNIMGARLSPADKVRLLQCEPSSERPCFRITINIIDQDGNALPIPFIDTKKALERTQVFEGESLLKTFYVGLNAKNASSLKRYAILLVDVSGSMGEKESSGNTKFEAMKKACSRFAESFADGIDNIAVIPFESHDVLRRIQQAVFATEKAQFYQQIKSISEPKSNANTGLFSSTKAALELLQKKRKEQLDEGIDPQCLLVVMTDGKNDVGNRKDNDDEGLLSSWASVADYPGQVGIPIITVGLGDSNNLDEGVMKQMAWPSKKNYIPARNMSDLLAAFENARSFQVNRLVITLLPKQDWRNQLILQHKFKVRLNLSPTNPIEETFEWGEGSMVAPPFEGNLTEDERKALPKSRDWQLDWRVTYFAVLIITGWLLILLWFKGPKLFWADKYDGQLLKARALSIVRLH